MGLSELNQAFLSLLFVTLDLSIYLSDPVSPYLYKAMPVEAFLSLSENFNVY
jgi:hypothetical protein